MYFTPRILLKNSFDIFSMKFYYIVTYAWFLLGHDTKVTIISNRFSVPVSGDMAFVVLRLSFIYRSKITQSPRRWKTGLIGKGICAFFSPITVRTCHILTVTWLDFYCAVSFHTIHKSPWVGWRHCRNWVTWPSRYDRFLLYYYVIAFVRRSMAGFVSATYKRYFDSALGEKKWYIIMFTLKSCGCGMNYARRLRMGGHYRSEPRRCEYQKSPSMDCVGGARQFTANCLCMRSHYTPRFISQKPGTIIIINIPSVDGRARTTIRSMSGVKWTACAHPRWPHLKYNPGLYPERGSAMPCIY